MTEADYEKTTTALIPALGLRAEHFAPLSQGLFDGYEHAAADYSLERLPKHDGLSQWAYNIGTVIGGALAARDRIKGPARVS